MTERSYEDGYADGWRDAMKESGSDNSHDADWLIVDDDIVEKHPDLEDYLGHKVKLYYSYDGEIAGVHILDP